MVLSDKRQQRLTYEHSHSDWQYYNTLEVSVVRGVARVMNMCTHNARGTDLRSFSETGREWMFPNSWLPSYGGGPPYPLRAAQRTRRGSGGPPPRKIWKKDRKWWHLMVFAVKIYWFKNFEFFYFFCKISKLNTATKLKIELYQVII